LDFKSYYGSSIREALQGARKELGPEAAILASRQTEDGSGRYEVVCGVIPASIGSGKQAPAAENGQGRPPVARRIAAERPAPQPEPAPKPMAEAQSGMSKLRRKFDGVRDTLTGTPSNPAETLLDQLWLSLIADGFGEDLTNEVVTGVRRRSRGLDFQVALMDELVSRTRLDASLGRGSGKRRITALVGPPGAGKTSLLVKLAVRYGLTGRRPMRLVSLDGSRVGGVDALERYASGMATPLEVVETGMALAQTLDTQAEAGLILIDTPGLSPSDMGAAQEFTTVLARHPEIDVQLVIPATMSPADMKATFERFRPLLPSRIVVTHTDAAVSCRAAVGLAMAHELPLSFVSTGPSVPEDLDEASVSGLLRPAAAQPKARSAVSAA